MVGEEAVMAPMFDGFGPVFPFVVFGAFYFVAKSISRRNWLTHFIIFQATYALGGIGGIFPPADGWLIGFGGLLIAIGMFTEHLRFQRLYSSITTAEPDKPTSDSRKERKLRRKQQLLASAKAIANDPTDVKELESIVSKLEDEGGDVDADEESPSVRAVLDKEFARLELGGASHDEVLQELDILVATVPVRNKILFRRIIETNIIDAKHNGKPYATAKETILNTVDERMEELMKEA